MITLNKKTGFSLVELAIGLAVITVLILAISLSSGIRDGARVQSASQSIQALRSSAEVFLSSGRMNYTGLSITVLKSENLLPNNFDATASNPWGGSYVIGANTTNNTKFDIALSSVPKGDSTKLMAYLQNSASTTSFDESKGILIATY